MGSGFRFGFSSPRAPVTKYVTFIQWPSVQNSLKWDNNSTYLVALWGFSGMMRGKHRTQSQGARWLHVHSCHHHQSCYSGSTCWIRRAGSTFHFLYRSAFLLSSGGHTSFLDFHIMKESQQESVYPHAFLCHVGNRQKWREDAWPPSWAVCCSHSMLLCKWIGLWATFEAKPLCS